MDYILKFIFGLLLLLYYIKYNNLLFFLYNYIKKINSFSWLFEGMVKMKEQRDLTSFSCIIKLVDNIDEIKKSSISNIFAYGEDKKLYSIETTLYIQKYFDEKKNKIIDIILRNINLPETIYIYMYDRINIYKSVI